MTIYVVGYNAFDRMDVKLVRAFKSAENRQKWLEKVHRWYAEMHNVPLPAPNDRSQLGYRLYEVELV